MKAGFTRSRGGYRAFQLGPVWITKAHLQRWVLIVGQHTVGVERTLRWASRLNWIESRDRERWFLR